MKSSLNVLPTLIGWLWFIVTHKVDYLYELESMINILSRIHQN